MKKIVTKIVTNREKFLLFIHFVFILIIAVLQTVYPMFVSSFIDNKNRLSGILWVLILFIVGKVLISILDILLNTHLYWGLFSRLRVRLTDALLEMDYSEVLKKEIGELTQTVENDSEQLVQFYIVFLTALLKNFLFVLGVLSVGLVIHLWIGMLMIAVLIILFVAFRCINHKAQRRWEHTKNEYQRFFSFMSKINTVMGEMNLLHEHQYLHKKFMDGMAKLCKADLLSSLISYELWLSTIMSFGFIKVVILLVGVILNLNLGSIYLFIYYVDLLNDPIEDLRIQLEGIPSTVEASKRVEKLLTAASTLRYGRMKLNNKIKDIKLENISFSYGAKGIFKEFDLYFQEGKIYGVIGKSGSGKSTLINLIARLYDVHEGTIRLNGTCISDFQKGELQKQMEYVGHLSQALASEKSVLILDEVFANTDEAKMKEAFATFKMKKQLVIVITHEKEIMQHCDELISLEEGSYASASHS